MSKQFRTCSLDQPFLLPPSLHDWLPEQHLARFVAAVVHHLDLSGIYECYEHKDGRGLAAYHPEMLTRLLLYGYAIGESSSRRIEQATTTTWRFAIWRLISIPITTQSRVFGSSIWRAWVDCLCRRWDYVRKQDW